MAENETLKNARQQEKQEAANLKVWLSHLYKHLSDHNNRHAGQKVNSALTPGAERRERERKSSTAQRGGWTEAAERSFDLQREAAAERNGRAEGLFSVCLWNLKPESDFNSDVSVRRKCQTWKQSRCRKMKTLRRGDRVRVWSQKQKWNLKRWDYFYLLVEVKLEFPHLNIKKLIKLSHFNSKLRSGWDLCHFSCMKTLRTSFLEIICLN